MSISPISCIHLEFILQQYVSQNVKYSTKNNAQSSSSSSSVLFSNTYALSVLLYNTYTLSVLFSNTYALSAYFRPLLAEGQTSTTDEVVKFHLGKPQGTIIDIVFFETVSVNLTPLVP